MNEIILDVIIHSCGQREKNSVVVHTSSSKCLSTISVKGRATLNLSCEVESSDSDGLRYSWYRDQQSVIDGKSSRITITRSNSQIYNETIVCVVKLNNLGEWTIELATRFTLIWADAPVS